MSQPIFREGTINFTYDGEIYQTYYKLFGELDGRTRDPIVVLHGGPGLVHDYLFPFANLATQHNFPVILYDQIGNGRSSHIKEKDPAFWTIDLFIDELVNLITHFSIQDGFDLVGHSWGGILASEFEVRRQPAGLKRLVLSNSLPAISLWTQSNMQLLEAFPEEVKKGIMEGMKDPEGYFRALKELHAVHGCLARPIPAEYWYTLDQVFGPAGDPTVASAPYVHFHCLSNDMGVNPSSP